VIAKTSFPVRDIQGLILSPEMTIAEAPEFDVLLLPGGFGQQQLMNGEEVLSLIRSHFVAGRLAFSVCTGALLCGAARVLRDRQSTTHWAAWNLLPYYGPYPFDRASSWMATWSPLPAPPRDSMPRWLSRRSCAGNNRPENSIEHSVCAQSCVSQWYSQTAPDRGFACLQQKLFHNRCIQKSRSVEVRGHSGRRCLGSFNLSSARLMTRVSLRESIRAAPGSHATSESEQFTSS
jgi:hypothetical protein